MCHHPHSRQMIVFQLLSNHPPHRRFARLSLVVIHHRVKLLMFPVRCHCHQVRHHCLFHLSLPLAYQPHDHRHLMLASHHHPNHHCQEALNQVVLLVHNHRHHLGQSQPNLPCRNQVHPSVDRPRRRRRPLKTNPARSKWMCHDNVRLAPRKGLCVCVVCVWPPKDEMKLLGGFIFPFGDCCTGFHGRFQPNRGPGRPQTGHPTHNPRRSKRKGGVGVLCFPCLLPKIGSVPQTVGELCNTLSLFGGGPIEKLAKSADNTLISDLNGTLASYGLHGTQKLNVTYRASQKPSLFVDTSAAGTETQSPKQFLFKTVEVPFDRTPFGLELEVSGCEFRGNCPH